MIKVIKVEERFYHHNYRKNAAGEVENDSESLGWFVLLSGSYEALHWGNEKPDLNPGDEVEVIIRKKIKK